MTRAEAREEARRAAAKYDKMASYIAAAMKILQRSGGFHH